jgi:hypothetical protein
MYFEPTNIPSQANNDSLQPVRTGLGRLWMGADHNVENTFVNGDDGKLEQIWIAARSEGGRSGLCTAIKPQPEERATTASRVMSRGRLHSSVNQL